MWALLAALAWAEPVQAKYDEGLVVESADGNWSAKVELRGQFRLSYPIEGNLSLDSNPVEPGELGPASLHFRIQRARLRWGGHAYRPWLRYYFEFDLVQPRILDLRFTVGNEAVSLRVGQWKAEYGRERRASSREQQLVDRSIVNDWFTIDRQMGLSLMGHLFEGTPGDLRYYLGSFVGWGARTVAVDLGPMLAGRLQWNFLGRDLHFAEGDLAFHEQPVVAVAIGGVHNRSPYTGFASAGGVQLPGYVDGDYTLNQGMVEVGFQYMGVSFQSEAHLKAIHDHGTGDDTLLRGIYAQAGWLPGGLLPVFPRQLEVVYRFAVVDPDADASADILFEHTGGVGWYFAGHRNKLQSDLTWFDFRQQGAEDTTFRVRLQWDVSL